MWVLTEDGQLINLAHVSGIFDNPYTIPADGANGAIIASLSRENESVLCTYNDAGRGGRVIVELAHHMHDAHKRGDNVITMHDVIKRITD